MFKGILTFGLTRRPIILLGLLVFIGVLGGVSAFGMLGLVLGPIVVAMAATLLEPYAPGANSGNTLPPASGKNSGAVLE